MWNHLKNISRGPGAEPRKILSNFRRFRGNFSNTKYWDWWEVISNQKLHKVDKYQVSRGEAPKNFEQFGRSRGNFSNTKYWDWGEIISNQKSQKVEKYWQESTVQPPGAEPRKILSNLGGLELISAIQNTEIVVKLEGCKMNNISTGSSRGRKFLIRVEGWR